MNNLVGIILLSSTVIFAALALFLLIAKMKQKKGLLKALESNQPTLEAQLTSDEDQLKNALGSSLAPQLSAKITEIILIEKECYSKITSLFIDYHPAAIEMLPLMMSQLISGYIQCIELVVSLNGTMPSTPEVAQPEIEPEPVIDIVEEVVQEDKVEEVIVDPDVDLDESSQYGILIEQLRFEKQDFSDRYKTAQNLLNLIYLKYKDKLEVSGAESLDDMSLSDIAAVFKVDLVPTVTKMS